MTHRVAIVGAGPSGFYAADGLLRARPDLHIDIIDRLPTPYGLVRAGVAPDHQGTKAVTRQFDRLLAQPTVRFCGNVEIGRDLSWEELSEHYDATIYGHKAVTSRLESAKRFKEIDGDLPGGARAYTIGKPRRYEMPIHLPSHKALAFGDAFVTTLEGDLRIWHWRDRLDADRIRWYRERFNPTIQPLLELDLERILVTHGPPILSYGSAALQAAVDAEPWYGGS